MRRASPPTGRRSPRRARVRGPSPCSATRLAGGNPRGWRSSYGACPPTRWNSRPVLSGSARPGPARQDPARSRPHDPTLDERRQQGVQRYGGRRPPSAPAVAPARPGAPPSRRRRPQREGRLRARAAAIAANCRGHEHTGPLRVPCVPLVAARTAAAAAAAAPAAATAPAAPVPATVVWSVGQLARPTAAEASCRSAFCTSAAGRGGGGSSSAPRPAGWPADAARRTNPGPRAGPGGSATAAAAPSAAASHSAAHAAGTAAAGDEEWATRRAVTAPHMAAAARTPPLPPPPPPPNP
jgi:hypothetical protein